MKTYSYNQKYQEYKKIYNSINETEDANFQCSLVKSIIKNEILKQTMFKATLFKEEDEGNLNNYILQTVKGENILDFINDNNNEDYIFNFDIFEEN
ncbi:MAG: hypothetical protein ACOYMA_00620 [Bacteroidia bacterium]